MTAFLTLLVACCAARGVSSAAAPLRFMVNYNDPELVAAGEPPAAFSEQRPRSKVHRSISFNFHNTAPETPAAEHLSDAVGRSLGNDKSIFFPGEGPSDGGNGDLGEITSSGDAAPGGLLLPSDLTRGVAAIEPARDCVVDDTLTMSYNGISWKLLSKGHCPDGEWAVMVVECQPECRPQPCPVGELEYQGRCVDPTDPTVCGEGQVLYLNQSGSTYCDCEQDHFYYPWSGQCYTRRQQGRCDFGFFLDINENGDVDCMPNECKLDAFEKDLVSGKCYRKDYAGYCPASVLEFHHNNQTVGCLMIHNRNLFDRAIVRSCGPGSRLNHLGRCRQEIVIPSITSQPRSLGGTCGRGAIRIGNGPCRRVNNFLS